MTVVRRFSLTTIFLRLLVASLPFYSLIKLFELSICLYLIGVLCIVSLFRLIKSGRTSLPFDVLDFALAGYLFSCILAFGHSSSETAPQALIKSIAYLTAFYLLSDLMRRFQTDTIFTVLRQGAIAGTLIFGLLTLYTYLTLGLTATPLNYWSVTMKVFGHIATEHFGYLEFSSSDLQRNGLAEVFIFYCIILFASRSHFRYPLLTTAVFLILLLL